jgi:hypothetical protein
MNISGVEVTGFASPDVMFKIVGGLAICFIIGGIAFAIWSWLNP